MTRKEMRMLLAAHAVQFFCPSDGFVRRLSEDGAAELARQVMLVADAILAEADRPRNHRTKSRERISIRPGN